MFNAKQQVGLPFMYEKRVLKSIAKDEQKKNQVCTLEKSKQDSNRYEESLRKCN